VVLGGRLAAVGVVERHPNPGSRICVIGTSGTGKTYVAEALANILGLRYVSNDALIWRANWQEVPREERFVAFEAATREGGWTFDGNLGPDAGDQLVLGRCDTIVWLDLPRWQVWPAITLRTLSRAWSREPMWHGNVERWSTVFSRDSMIWWSIKTYSMRRRRYTALFASPDLSGKALIRLRSRGEINAWLASLAVSQPEI
jgi:adenylate kinase family enzyme